MNIPEGFTPRGDSNEQPPETYDKWVELVLEGGKQLSRECAANAVTWKVPTGPARIIAYKVLP